MAIDFKQMGRLSSAEKDVMERMFQVIKLFQRLDVDDQEKRSAAFDTVQNEYAHMAVLIMVVGTVYHPHAVQQGKKWFGSDRGAHLVPNAGRQYPGSPDSFSRNLCFFPG